MTTRIDRTIQDTYTTRYENLNGLDYQEYLKSDHWQMVKKKAKRRKAYQKCQFCDSKNIDLHHTSKCSVRIATNELRRKYSPFQRNNK